MIDRRRLVLARPRGDRSDVQLALRTQLLSSLTPPC